MAAPTSAGSLLKRIIIELEKFKAEKMEGKNWKACSSLPKVQRFTLKNRPAAITKRPSRRVASRDVRAAPNSPR
jgi:hypothetical protein